MNRELVKRILSSIILLPVVFYCLLTGSFFLVSLIIISFIITCYEWNRMNKKKANKILGFIFLLFAFYTFYELSIELFLLIYVILICISTDLGGYIFGKIFKGPKLTKISPNKTFSGMIGGYIFSVISSIIFTDYTFDRDLPNDWIIFALVISTISQFGDVVISYFKRKSKLKDTGKIIPGHGGLLDRVDGMIFAFPFAYLISLLDII